MENEKQNKEVKKIREKLTQPKIPVTLNLNKNDYEKIQNYLKKLNREDPHGDKITFSHIINFYMKDLLKNDKIKEEETQKNHIKK